MPTKIDRINALSELERIGWKFDALGNDEVRCLCPAHDDSNPSCTLNVKKNLWKCHSCQAKGDIVTFIAYAMKVKRQTVIIDLSSRYDLEDVKEINLKTVEKFHQEIWSAGPLLQALYDRGLTDETIRKRRLGFHNGRLTIPVF